VVVVDLICEINLGMRREPLHRVRELP
jgi:hypothetical protein